jgi:hypothetical protein
MNTVILIVLLFAQGPAAAVTAGALAGIAFDLATRRPLTSLVTNFTITVLAFGMTGRVYAAVGGVPGHLDLPISLVQMLVAAGCVAASTEVLMAIWNTVAADNLRKAVRDEFATMWVYISATFIECLTGLAVAVVFMLDPWATPVLVPLGLSLYVALLRGARVQQITDRALESFAALVDERDPYTAEHSSRVCEYSMMIGEELLLPDARLQALYWTSRLHDLGKVAVDNSILNKPGKLTDEEFEIMKSHPVVSARILNSFSFNEYDTDVVLCHHERYDGRGYLHRPAVNVPFEAFIIAVADSYDAMTSDRPYRKALPKAVALHEIHRNLGTQFEPVAGAAFLKIMGFRAEEEVQPHAELGSAAIDRAEAA